MLVGLGLTIAIITSQPDTLVPPIYVSIVSHNEEPATGMYPDFTVDTAAFWEHRAALLDFSEMLHEEGVMFNYQSDWNFLLAATLFDTGTVSTNGKNFLKYLEEDLGFEVDPHAHETQYNYADVAYLMHQLLGHEPSHTVGGYIACPPQSSQIEYFRDTLHGWNYPYAWKAEILWGGSFQYHIGDDSLWTSGVWKPKDNYNYLLHDEYAPLPEIGRYNGTWQGLWDLIEKQENGELVYGRIYTATIFLEQSMMLDPAFIDTFRNRIQSLASYTNSGRIVWVGLSQAKEIWETEYNSRPNLYSYLYGDITQPIRDTFWLEMSDGVHLDVTVYKPVDLPPPIGFPGIVFVHGLGGSKYQMEQIAQEYANHGYVTLAYSVRGQGNSEGLTTIFSYREQEDLDTIIHWLGRFPEVNDTLIGVSGASQGGFHSFLAGVRNMGVRAVAPENSTPQVSYSVVRNGCYYMAVTTPLEPSPGIRLDTIAYPIKRLLLEDDYDSIRTIISWGRDFDSLDIANSSSWYLIIGAWLDHIFWTNLLPSAFRNTPLQSYLYLGTGGHGSPQPPSERTFRNALRQAFFDTYLKGDTIALDTFSTVTVSLGPNWKHLTFQSYPPPDLHWDTLYLHSDGTLSSLPPGDADSSFHLTHQLLDPSYTWEAAVNDHFAHSVNAFLLTQRFWSTPPLTDSLMILGTPVAKIHAKSTAPRFQINIQLYDDPPDSLPIFLTQFSYGIRENPDTTTWYTLEGEFNSIGWVLPPGHRLRVEWRTLNISADDGSLWTLPFWGDGIHTLALNSSQPSYIVLPVLTTIPNVSELPPVSVVPPLRVVPNPARNAVNFVLNHDTRAPVTIEVYDAMGRRIWRKNLMVLPNIAPRIHWKGVTNQGKRVPNGLYFVQLRMDDEPVEIKKFVYMR